MKRPVCKRTQDACGEVVRLARLCGRRASFKLRYLAEAPRARFLKGRFSEEHLCWIRSPPFRTFSQWNASRWKLWHLFGISGFLISRISSLVKREWLAFGGSWNSNAVDSFVSYDDIYTYKDVCMFSFLSWEFFSSRLKIRVWVYFLFFFFLNLRNKRNVQGHLPGDETDL